MNERGGWNMLARWQHVIQLGEGSSNPEGKCNDSIQSQKHNPLHVI